ncbi:MAG TPA: ABC transporter ATP-binding protein [Nitrospiria bacterium]|nr:ABC transporter ATP-binding protein [Nitrospiria bacterium]
MASIYTLRDVSFRYESEWVLHGIDLTIDRGEILGLIGPNGSGKTTLLKILGRHRKPETGGVWLESEDLSNISLGTLARRVSMVPQELPVAFPYTVLEMVLMGRYPHMNGWAFESAEDHRIALSAMERMGVDSFAHRLFTELSGGEKQRVIIARALAQQAEILLLDEPATFLDLHHQAGIYRLLGELNRQDRITVVVVLHDLTMASQLCRRLLLLNEGRVFRLGTPPEVLTEKVIEEVYRCRTVVDSHPTTGHPRVTVIPD